MDEEEGLVVIGAPKLKPRLVPRLNVLQPPPLPLSAICMFDFVTHVCVCVIFKNKQIKNEVPQSKYTLVNK